MCNLETTIYSVHNKTTVNNLKKLSKTVTTTAMVYTALMTQVLLVKSSLSIYFL